VCFKVNNDQFHGKIIRQDQPFDNSKVECFRCHKFGHYHSECYSRMLNVKEKGEQSNLTKKKVVETLLMVVQVDQELEFDVWYVDTRCHTCGNKSSFSYLNKYFHSTVSFGDCSTMNMLGNGDIEIKTKNGFVKTISNVLYNHDLKSNMLSAGQLQEKKVM